MLKYSIKSVNVDTNGNTKFELDIFMTSYKTLVPFIMEFDGNHRFNIADDECLVDSFSDEIITEIYQVIRYLAGYTVVRKKDQTYTKEQAKVLLGKGWRKLPDPEMFFYFVIASELKSAETI